MKHKLSAAEVAERAQTLATKIHDLEAAVEEKKDMSKEYGDKIKALRKEIRTLSEVVATGQEWRSDQLAIWPKAEEDAA